jgi:hypothetical protein
MTFLAEILSWDGWEVLTKSRRPSRSSRRMTAVGTGDILAPLRLLTTSALFLDKKASLDEGSFLDFSTFITALTLHDRLITLPVADIPDKIMNTPLFSYLADHGILKVLQWDIMNDFEREASNELEVLFEEKVTDMIFLIGGETVSSWIISDVNT